MNDKTRSERFLSITGYDDWEGACKDLCDGDLAAQFDDDNWIAEDHRPVHVERWLLIEEGRYGQTWTTFHATPEAAADYHDGQEHVEDWGDYKLYDLDSEDEFYPQVTTTWVKFDRV